MADEQYFKGFKCPMIQITSSLKPTVVQFLEAKQLFLKMTLIEGYWAPCSLFLFSHAFFPHTSSLWVHLTILITALISVFNGPLLKSTDPLFKTDLCLAL